MYIKFFAASFSAFSWLSNPFTVKTYFMNATEGYYAVIFNEYVQITEKAIQKSIDVLVKVVESEASTLASTAMEALGHIGLRCALPSINRNSSQGKMCFSHFRYM